MLGEDGEHLGIGYFQHFDNLISPGYLSHGRDNFHEPKLILHILHGEHHLEQSVVEDHLYQSQGHLSLF